MFRLIKWALYAVVGYMLYEMYQGLSAERSGGQGSSGGRQPEPRPEMDRAVKPGVGTMTGPGEGKRVRTEEPSGAGGSHIVGRGVI